jgi:hypothetical protein
MIPSPAVMPKSATLTIDRDEGKGDVILSLFEWIGEAFSRGSYGTIEFGPDPEDRREPLSLVLFKVVLSAVFIGLIDSLIFSFLVAPTPQSLAVASVCHLVYFALGYYVRPKPDESELGLSGTILDDPLSVSDDVNRSLLFWQIVLLPGRFVAEAVVHFIAPLFGRRKTTRRVRHGRAPGIAVPRILRRALPILALSILCVGCAVAAFQTWRQGREVETWRSVDGKVVQRWTERNDTLADAKMRIQYNLDGQTYSTIQDGYTSDAVTTIFVDPQDPTHVSRGFPRPKFLVLVVLSVVGGVGAIGWLALTLWPELASEDHRYESS